MAKKNYIHVEQARSKDQKKVMKKILADEVCPFCPEHLSKYHKKPILKQGKHWILTNNQWPYENTNVHLLAIHKTHIEHLDQLKPMAAKELIGLFQWGAKKYNIPGGAVAIRFGSNPKHGNYGSTVLHLHAHLIEPDLKNSTKKPVRFKIGQPKKK